MHILAGQFKGRKLLSPSRRSPARPITALAKKSLFGMIEARLDDAAVLDLYCGTGTLGLEALSRGARKVFFAEKDRDTVGKLARNIETLSASDRCEVWAGDVLAKLARRLDSIAAAVDVAFVDPPYAHARRWRDESVRSDIDRRLFAPIVERLSADGLVVLRVPADAATIPPPCGLAIARTRRYGEMTILLLARKGLADGLEIAKNRRKVSDDGWRSQKIVVPVF